MKQSLIDNVAGPAKFVLFLSVPRAKRNFSISEIHRITTSPEICVGRPCLRSLRVRVKDILDLLAADADHEEILADYPMLEKENILTVLEYVARQSDHPILPVA